MIYRHVDDIRQAFLSTFDGGRRPGNSKIHAHAHLEIIEQIEFGFSFSTTIRM